MNGEDCWAMIARNGIPVLGSDGGGLGDLMRGGGTPLPKDDATAWLHAIQALDNRDAYEEASARGTRFVRSFYSPDQIVTDIRELFVRVRLEGGKAAPV